MVEGRRYRSLLLTGAGPAIADRSRARHKIVLDFLRSLGIGQDTAEIDAERIEHHVSDETLSAIRRSLTGGDADAGTG